MGGELFLLPSTQAEASQRSPESPKQRSDSDACCDQHIRSHLYLSLAPTRACLIPALRRRHRLAHAVTPGIPNRAVMVIHVPTNSTGLAMATVPVEAPTNRRSKSQTTALATMTLTSVALPNPTIAYFFFLAFLGFLVFSGSSPAM